MARLDRKVRKRVRSKEPRIYGKQSKWSKLMYINSIVLIHLIADRYNLYQLIEELIKKYIG